METPIPFLTMVRELNIPAYRYFEATDSTNSAALSWLDEGAPDGAIVFANHQRSGKGRLQRRWITNPGSALALSMIMKPTLQEKEYIQLFSAVAALALVKTLKEKYQIAAQIKWPNDVLIDRKKCAGILLEAAWQGQELAGIVIGIGVNIFPASLPPADLLLFPATCVQNHTQLSIERFDFLGNLITVFSGLRANFNFVNFHNQWENLLAFRGETVYIIENDIIHISGTLSGVELNGDLRLITQDGKCMTFTAADVHLRPTNDVREERYD